jgi:3',5'-cyclic AMP phosphodiesterase CpdA
MPTCRTVAEPAINLPPHMLIAHLSDPHLRPRSALYHGLVDSNAMFEAAVRHLNALSPAPDLVIISGDIVDTGSAEEYATARDLLRPILQKVLVIPGNHDGREAFRTAFTDHNYLPPTGPLHFVFDSAGPVRVIGFDVTVPGEHHGDVDDAAAAWLEAALASEPDRPTLIMMHQPPIEIGVPYLDPYRCFNADRLEAIISRYPAVERVLCGHVHRMLQRRFGGTILLTAPSTTSAIALRFCPDAEPASFIEPPAMLLHQWRPDGMITHVVPIGMFPGPYDFA